MPYYAVNNFLEVRDLLQIYGSFRIVPQNLDTENRNDLKSGICVYPEEAKNTGHGNLPKNTLPGREIKVINLSDKYMHVYVHPEDNGTYISESDTVVAIKPGNHMTFISVTQKNWIVF